MRPSRGSCARAWRATGSRARPPTWSSGRSMFALYGFPESHSASFALMSTPARTSRRTTAVFYAALSTTSRWGSITGHAGEGRAAHGVRFSPSTSAIELDVRDRRRRLRAPGLKYVNGLRRQIGMAIEAMGMGSVVSRQYSVASRRTEASSRTPEARRLSPSPSPSPERCPSATPPIRP